MLPLGVRVQQKLEALLEKHMRSIGSSTGAPTQDSLDSRAQMPPKFLFPQSPRRNCGKRAGGWMMLPRKYGRRAPSISMFVLTGARSFVSKIGEMCLFSSRRLTRRRSLPWLRAL